MRMSLWGLTEYFDMTPITQDERDACVATHGEEDPLYACAKQGLYAAFAKLCTWRTTASNTKQLNTDVAHD